MKILQYIRLHIKNSITPYNTFHFFRYAHFTYAKCFANKHTATIEYVKK